MGIKTYTLISWSFICMMLNSVFAQNYTPVDTNNLQDRTLSAVKFKDNSLLFIKDIDANYPKKTSKIITKDYQEFATEFTKKIEKGDFLLNSPFEEHVRKILDEILIKNNINPQSINLLISKNSSLNAFCLIDNTFVINFGVFYWLDNDSQLASILCHELAHNRLKHSLNTILTNIEADQNQVHKDLKNSVSKSRYNKADKAFEVLKNLVYQRGELSKKREYEADSLGFLFYKNTGYKTNNYPKALEMMIKYDTIKPQGLSAAIYRKLFDLPQQPFKESWTKSDSFEAYNYDLYKEKLDLKAMSTHPEAEERISYLKSIFPEIGSENPREDNNPTEAFKQLEKLAAMEMIPQLIYSEDYGLALYLSLLRIQRAYETDYHKKWIGVLFQKIYDARKAYKLNRYIEQINPKKHDESYQYFLNFVWNLNLTEIETIYKHYQTIN